MDANSQRLKATKLKIQLFLKVLEMLYVEVS